MVISFQLHGAFGWNFVPILFAGKIDMDTSGLEAVILQFSLPVSLCNVLDCHWVSEPKNIAIASEIVLSSCLQSERLVFPSFRFGGRHLQCLLGDSITEVKLRRARLVPGWVTAREG